MRVAALHFGKTSNLDVNEDELIKLNIQAADEYGAKLIVNPEQSILPLWTQSGPIANNSKADDVARSREFATWFATERCPLFVKRVVDEVADPYKCYVVVSVITSDPEHYLLFSTALVLGPRTDKFKNGVYHTYNKTDLYGDIYAVKGTSPLQPANLDIGKIGVLVCADYSLPLISRSLVINGSDLIVVPAALSSSTIDTLRARMVENCTPFALSNCFEQESAYEEPYCPQSAIVSATEEQATNRCENTILTAEIDISNNEITTRRKKILSRRHPNLYAGALTDLTSWVLRFGSPKRTEPEITVITISAEATFKNEDFTEEVDGILAQVSGPVIVVLPEFPLERPDIQKYLDYLKQREVYAVCGFLERPHIVVALFGPDGTEMMRYKKVHLSDGDVENRIEPGNRLEFYLDLPMGRVAILSGQDLSHPEVIEILRNCAVDLILASANLDFDSDVLGRDIAHSRHLSIAIADYGSFGGVYKRVSRKHPEQQIAAGNAINFLTFNTRHGRIRAAKGLPAVPQRGGEILVRK